MQSRDRDSADTSVLGNQRRKGAAAQRVKVAHFGIHAVPIVIASFAILTLGAFGSALLFTSPLTLKAA